MSEHQLVLLDAIEKGHTSIVLKLLRNHVSLNFADMYGRTPLMTAAKYKRVEITKILLEHMGNIDIKADHGGKTALHYAAESAELPIVKMLCKREKPSTAMETTKTKLKPLDYALRHDEIFTPLHKYAEGGEVSGDDTDDDDEETPVPGMYVKPKKKKGSGKKKGGKKSGTKKKKSGKKKK